MMYGLFFHLISIAHAPKTRQLQTSGGLYQTLDVVCITRSRVIIVIITRVPSIVFVRSGPRKYIHELVDQALYYRDLIFPVFSFLSVFTKSYMTNVVYDSNKSIDPSILYYRLMIV